ncbi:MAG TPA: hypothetical protein VF637_03020 [Sphingomicrobium sp.]|jgi:hypothetical protein
MAPGKACGRREHAAGEGGATYAAQCTIKGNISPGGERIYHLPGTRDYERTRINDRAGERLFCSEDESKAAGWRSAQRRRFGSRTTKARRASEAGRARSDMMLRKAVELWKHKTAR